MSDATGPLWLQNIDSALPTISQFVLHGEIRDLVPSFDEAGSYTGSMGVKEAIWGLLEANGFDAMIEYSLPDRLVIHTAADGVGQDDVMRFVNDGSTYGLFDGRSKDITPGRIDWFESTDQLVAMLDTTMIESDPDDLPSMSLALLIDYSSQADFDEITRPERDKLMIACLKHVHKAADFIHRGFRGISIKHPIFWLVDRPNDLPGWVLSGDGIRQVPLLQPDYDERVRFARAVLLSSERTSGDIDELVGQLASVTEGVTNRGILEIYKLLLAGDIEKERIVEASRQYRLGITENPWQKPELRRSIGDGERLLSEAVYGQEKAIRRAVDMLMQSSLNLTHAHSRSGGSGPRGVMFFAGATGVGKTELAKSIAKLVFGSADRIVRFDMSEFSQEHTESRLVGAPPSYIGHGAGGELTNAIRKQPHSVVLFDEIEKAHGRILDKFLQILSDGRLTDGSGDTVYFTETIIIFTSNKGAEEAGRILEQAANLNVDLASDSSEARTLMDEYEATIKAAVRRYFNDADQGLGRPELLGRIGEQNIVIFKPITPSIAERIALRCISNILYSAASQNGCVVELSDKAQEQCVALAVADLTKGGRGIIDSTRDALVGPLARILFENDGIDRLLVTAIGKGPDGGYLLEVGR
jgi:hypothetical protein